MTCMPGADKVRKPSRLELTAAATGSCPQGTHWLSLAAACRRNYPTTDIMPLLAALRMPLLSASVQRLVVPVQIWPNNELNARASAALPAAQRLLYSRLSAEQYAQAAAVLQPRFSALRCFRCAAWLACCDTTRKVLARDTQVAACVCTLCVRANSACCTVVVIL